MNPDRNRNRREISAVTRILSRDAVPNPFFPAFGDRRRHDPDRDGSTLPGNRSATAEVKLMIAPAAKKTLIELFRAQGVGSGAL